MREEIIARLAREEADRLEEESERLLREEEKRVAALPEDKGKPKKKVVPEDDPWEPRLSADGFRVFNFWGKYGLAHGERGSGKTFAVLHKLLRHCYDNNGALAVICMTLKSSATSGGAWEKLQLFILPEWADGIGLEGDGPNGDFVERRDTEQNRIIWVSTHDGGWAKIMLKSLTHDQHIKERMKGTEPSFFFFDELTETDVDASEYFDHPIQQIGRRQGPDGRKIQHQQYWGACNPADQGEKHWVFQTFFVKANQRKPEDFGVFHIKIEDNIWMEDLEGYLDNIRQACRGDPNKEARWLHGRWVAQPSGEGIFAGYYSRSRHVRGDVNRKRGIIPVKKIPVEIGYDLGTANQSMSFMQHLIIGERNLWTVFDELVIIGRPTPLRDVALMLLRRMNHWCVVAGQEFHFNHISDNAAFNQQRTDGSYDYRVIQQTIRNELNRRPELYPGLTIGGIKLVAAPKPHGSIASRVRGTISRLQHDEILVSALCIHHTEMFEQLEKEKDKGRGYSALLPFTPKKDALGHIHVHDSFSYPQYHYDLGGSGSPRVPRESEMPQTELLDLHV